MATPTPHVESVVEWCSIGPRAWLLTGFLREWLQQHFSTAGGIEHPELRSLLWRAMDDSPILIESVTRWLPEQTETRPAVVIKRNDWSVDRVGIGDFLQGDSDLTGTDHYSILLTGSHTLFCIARNAQQAEILAAEVYREFLQFGPAIRQALDLKRFLVAGAGALALLEEAAQTYVVPVTVGYAFEEKWMLIPHAPVLKRIELRKLLP